jgi:hypothetical protein
MDFSTFASQVARLSRSLLAVEAGSGRLRIAPLEGREWFELLQCKLLPQVKGPPLLIVAIVGGTNIGKSVIFNHLAGETASAATPLAAGTKHPVCLSPPGCNDPALLGRLFEHFRLRAWQSPDDPLIEAAEDLIFWRVGRNVPPRLVLLDAPDVDSDATVNWQRARAVRQAADVLIALLTQQKYNDAAVKEYIQEAVLADKPIIVIFNLCDLDADRAYWPQWLGRFCAETGADPELVYVVPHDRNAAAELRLPFYRVSNSPATGQHGTIESASSSPSDLRNELAAMHFDAIKVRTLRGALDRVLDPVGGLPAYLDEVRAMVKQFAAAADALSASEMARVTWPSLPANALVEEMRRWWDGRRSDWSRRIHGYYRAAWRGATLPIRAGWAAVAGPPEDPLDGFRRQERAAVITAVEKMLDELQRLARVGNDILQPRLRILISGPARAELLARVEREHRELPTVDDDYRAALRAELDALQASCPQTSRWLHALDHAGAMVRPVITVTLAVSGWVFAGSVVGPAVMHVAGQVAGHLASEVVVAGGGEAIVAGSGEGLRQAAARLFRSLQVRFAQKRAKWLADFLEAELLGDLLDELRLGAAAADTREFREVETALAELRKMTTSIPAGE